MGGQKRGSTRPQRSQLPAAATEELRGGPERRERRLARSNSSNFTPASDGGQTKREADSGTFARAPVAGLGRFTEKQVLGYCVCISCPDLWPRMSK